MANGTTKVAGPNDGGGLRVTTLTLPVASIGGDDPVPLVDRTLETPFDGVDELPDHLRRGASFGTPRSMHPYLVQNRYTRERRPADLMCVVLENEQLRAMFLPELGGRLWSLLDRGSGRELLYRNPVIQPANLALRNAWFAGGVEWNIATKGHGPHTASPLHAAKVLGADGVPTLRMWEYERLRRVVYQVDARLPPGSRTLQVYVRVRNPNGEDVPMYWWSNAAVPESDDVRVISPARDAYTTAGDGTLRTVSFPVDDSGDRSRPTRSRHAADYFFELTEGARPWIAAVDASGHGLAQVSTERLVGRKMFCWGTGAGGRRWQQWLSPEDGRYLEIQAGLATTQMEHVVMPGDASWSWLESYGDVAAEAGEAHGEWGAATRHLAERLEDLAPEDGMQAALDRATDLADTPPAQMLAVGSGWGALESAARAATGQGWVDETGTPFLAETMGPEQQPWHDLLANRAGAEAALAGADPRSAPPSYVTGAPWSGLLRDCPATWARDYHLGVMAHAQGTLEAAQAYYWSSVKLQPTAWALHGLARIARERQDAAGAAEVAASATALAPEEPTIRLEAVDSALEAGDGPRALELVETAPPEIRQLGRFRLLEARAALATGDVERAAALLQDGIVVPDVREGETALSDLWSQVFPDEPMPGSYDFRMR